MTKAGQSSRQSPHEQPASDTAGPSGEGSLTVLVALLLTDRGWQVLHAGLRVVADFDQWLATELGASQVQQLRDTLDRIITADWTASTKE